MDDITYPINEIFVTIQGEASFTGTPSYFIRLQGCDVGCPWCDTKHTWDLDSAAEVTFNQLITKTADKNSWAYVKLSQIKDFIQTNSQTIIHVVITGGEPASYDLKPLCVMLEDLGKTVQIETSGTQPLSVSNQTWVTLSPKINMPGNKVVLSECILRANEIKMPIGKMADIEKLKTLLITYNVNAKALIWLQPLSQNPEATKLCINQALVNNWHLSLQTHKFINIR